MMFDKIKALYDELPKVVKVFCFIAVSYTLKFIGVKTGLIEDSALAEYITGLINIILVIIEESAPIVKDYLKK